MKQAYILIAGLAALLSACSGNQEETPLQPTRNAAVHVTARLDNAETRVSFDNDGTVTHLLWDKGDKIELSTADGGYCGTYTLFPSEDGTTAELVADGTPLNNAEGQTVYAVYGSPSWNGEGGNRISFPTRASGSVADTTPFLYATGTVTDNTLNLHFRHFYAYLRLTLTKDIFSNTYYDPDQGGTFELRCYSQADNTASPLAVQSGTFDFTTLQAETTGMDVKFSIGGSDLWTASWTGYVPVLSAPSQGGYVELIGSEGVFLKRNVPEGGFLAGHLYALDTGSDAIIPLLEVNKRPTVTTQPVSEVGETSARWTGTVDYTDNATFGFEYALNSDDLPADRLGTASSKELVQTADWDSELSAYRFTTEFTELQPNTTYYVRAFARNASGNKYYGLGEILSFTTSATPVYPPSVGTTTAANITESGVDLSARITSVGSSEIIEKGFYYSTESTVEYGAKVTSNASGNDITAQLTGLTPNTTYYVCAFATNSIGETRGEVHSFTTLAVHAPTVDAPTFANITTTGADLAARITSIGSSAVTQKGFYYSAGNAEPTSENGLTVTSDAVADNDIIAQLTGLTPNTTYYVRAFAINSVGETLGEVRQFKTLPVLAPAVSSTTVANVTTTGADLSARVTSDGGSAVTQKGFYYSIENTNPTAENGTQVTSNASGNDIIFQLTGLTPSTRYYVRAFATNSEGETLGAVEVFTTGREDTTPTISVVTVSNVTSSGFSLSAILQDNGGAAITEKGFCYSTTNANPTVGDSKVVSTAGGDNITTELTGLNPITTYYVRAYANNGTKIGYSETVTVTTIANNVPGIDDNVSPEQEF